MIQWGNASILCDVILFLPFNTNQKCKFVTQKEFVMDGLTNWHVICNSLMSKSIDIQEIEIDARVQKKNVTFIIYVSAYLSRHNAFELSLGSV